MTARGELRERVRGGETLLGCFMSLDSAIAAEACARAGLDWVLVDLEHGGNEAALLGQLQAAQGAGAAALVRVESDARARVGRPLDLGADGIMFPRVESAEHARTAIGHLRYPPDGDRGVAAYNRAYSYGGRVDLLPTAAERLVGIAQIESRAAVRAAREIAAVDGVDVLFVGPGDLSHDMGRFGAFDDPEVQAAFAAVVDAAEAEGKAAGILVRDVARAQAAAAAGFRFIGVGTDAGFVYQAAARIAEAGGGS